MQLNKDLAKKTLGNFLGQKNAKVVCYVFEIKNTFDYGKLVERKGEEKKKARKNKFIKNKL